MRDVEVHLDAECRRGMRDAGAEASTEVECGIRKRLHHPPHSVLLPGPISNSPLPLVPNPAFLFCILHRGELPYPAFISPLPPLPLKGAGFARWPLGSLSRSWRGSLRGRDELERAQWEFEGRG